MTNDFRTRGALLLAGAVAVASWNCSVGSLAQPAAGDPAPASEDVSLTISGGVSLGSYEAGYVYVWTGAVRQIRRHRLRVVTGTSAGSINALIAVINSCRNYNDSPHEDLGWITWVEMGFDDLFIPNEVKPTHVFSRGGLDDAVTTAREAWSAGFQIDCDVLIGVPVTGLESERIQVHDAIALPRQLEKFVLRIRGKKNEGAATISNYVNTRPGLPQILLPLKEDGGLEDFELLKQALFASSAFPLAFAPECLGFCLRKGSSLDQPCDEAEKCALFLDGGVFDNHPLRLAVEISLYKTADDRTESDTSSKSLRERVSPGGLRYHYLNPGIASYGSRSSEHQKSTFEILEAFGLGSKKDEEAGALEVLGGFVGELVKTARSNELYTLAEEQSVLVSNVRVARRVYPTMSELLGAFLGFFERDFRVFDFYLGMYDAYSEALHRPHPGEATITRDELLSVMHPFLKPNATEAIWKDWLPFACMLAWYESETGDPRFQNACKGKDLRDFRVLLQVSMDRLHDACATSEREASTEDSPKRSCGRTQRPKSIPPIEGVDGSKIARPSERGADEKEFDYVMRLLAEYQFTFDDLDLDEAQAKTAPVQIRRKLNAALVALSREQPSRIQHLGMLTGGRFALSTIAYEPPKHWGYFTLGAGLELGGSIQPFRAKSPNPLRLNLALQIASFRTFVKPSVETVTFYLVGGLEFQLLFWKWSPKFQPMLGLRGGYQFGIADRFHSRPCTGENALGDARNCSQPVVQPYVAIAFIERLRIQLTFALFPKTYAFGDRSFDAMLGVGYQFFCARMRGRNRANAC